MRWLYSNLGYKLVAVAMAFLLWGVAHSSSSIERGFDVPMVLRGLPDDLVIVGQSTNEVNVRIQGSRAALRNLSAGDLEYPVEVSGAKPGILKVEVDPMPLEVPRGARVVSRSPSIIELTLARRGSKTVRVRADLAGEPAPNFRVAGVDLDPPRVKVVGAQPEVLRLNEVLTETIDVTGASSDVVKEVSVALGGRNLWLEETKPVTARVRIEPVDGAGEAPAGAEEGRTG